MELGCGGFDPYDIADLDSDTSSDEDAYRPIQGFNEQLQQDREAQKQAERNFQKLARRSVKKKGKKRPYRPKTKQSQEPAVDLAAPTDTTAVDLTAPMDIRAGNETYGGVSSHKDYIPDDTYLQWTSPSMRRRQEEFNALDGFFRQEEQPSTSVNNSIGRQREISKLLSLPHLRDKQVELQQLLSAETEEEIATIHSGQELGRQRQAICTGPLHVQAMFGNVQVKDIAAIDSGATQNFVSKSWLYDYLKQGGNMKVLSFGSNGHETFDGNLLLYIWDCRAGRAYAIWSRPRQDSETGCQCYQGLYGDV